MSVKTSVTEITENSNKDGSSDITNRRRCNTDKGLLMPSSGTGLNKLYLHLSLCFMPLWHWVFCPKHSQRQLVYVFHPGRQGARDILIPFVFCTEPRAAVPTVLGIIKNSLRSCFLVAGLTLLFYACAIPKTVITRCLGLDIAIIKMINRRVGRERRYSFSPSQTLAKGHQTMENKMQQF